MANEDRRWLEKLRRMPCAMCGQTPAGTVHHPKGAGMGLRSHDRRGIPMCGSGVTGCHGSLENPMIRGPFKGWDRERRREWERDMSDYYEAVREEET